MSKEASKLSVPDTKIRREAWAQIRAVLQKHGIDTSCKFKSLTDAGAIRSALSECYHIASCYAAMTGDDSLFPPKINSDHTAMVQWLNENYKKMQARRRMMEKDKEHGIVSLI